MFSNKNKSYLFDFLGYYECVKNQPQKFHFNDVNFQDFLTQNGIFVGSFSKKSEEERKKLKPRYFIVIRGTASDTAHNILRHIRNAIAHNRIKYVRTNTIIIEDYSSATGNVTMSANLHQNMLVSLIKAIKQTYK